MEDTTKYVREEFIRYTKAIRYGQWIGAILGMVLGLWMASMTNGPVWWYLVITSIIGPLMVFGDYFIQRNMHKAQGYNRETALLMCAEMAYREEIGDESPTEWPELF